MVLVDTGTGSRQCALGSGWAQRRQRFRMSLWWVTSNPPRWKRLLPDALGHRGGKKDKVRPSRPHGDVDPVSPLGLSCLRDHRPQMDVPCWGRGRPVPRGEELTCGA